MQSQHIATYRNISQRNLCKTTAEPSPVQTGQAGETKTWAIYKCRSKGGLYVQVRKSYAHIHRMFMYVRHVCLTCVFMTFMCQIVL